MGREEELTYKPFPRVAIGRPGTVVAEETGSAFSDLNFPTGLDMTVSVLSELKAKKVS